MIKNKRILITGGAGSIGSELVRQLSKENKVYILDINEIGVLDLTEEAKQDGLWIYGRVGDIRDKITIHDVFSDFKPQIVFHAAAYKSVNMMELSPIEAIQTNIVGTYNVLSEAKNWECLEKFVFVSSDKSVNGHSIMGISKKMCEVMVCNQGKRFLSVRFGNVLGSRGSLISIWENQLKRGKPITITDSRMERYFMSIEDAVRLIIEATQMGKGGEVFCLDMGKKVNILSLAKRLTEELKFDNIKINTIGIREGETLTEVLMTEEESRRAIKKGNFWIIPLLNENKRTDKKISKRMEKTKSTKD